MIRTARRMLSCHFTARRMQRYLDADPAALLTEAELHRMESHLAECERCSGAFTDFRALRGTLRGVAQFIGPRPDAVDRMRRLVDDLVEGQPR